MLDLESANNYKLDARRRSFPQSPYSSAGITFLNFSEFQVTCFNNLPYLVIQDNSQASTKGCLVLQIYFSRNFHVQFALRALTVLRALNAKRAVCAPHVRQLVPKRRLLYRIPSPLRFQQHHVKQNSHYSNLIMQFCHSELLTL